MNHIRNIEIKNFKSIRQQTIEDCRRVNVFIGYPNVGKSNILEALSLFSLNTISELVKDFIRIEKLTTFFFDGNIDEDVAVVINSVDRIVGKYEGNFLSLRNQYDSERHGFDVIDKSEFTITRPEVSELWSYGIDDLGRSSRCNGANGIKLDDGSSTVKVGKYVFNKSIAFMPGNGQSLLHPFGENIFSVISGNRQIKNEVKEIFAPNNLELLFDTRQQIFTILKRTVSGIFTIPYELIADTLQRLIFFKTAIYSNKNSVLLFEEPEAHMFPPYISKLTSDIINDENNNQFFLATHSPFVLNDLIANSEKDELSVFIVTYENQTGETLVHRMSEDDVNDAYQFGYDFFMNINNFIPQKEHG